MDHRYNLALSPSRPLDRPRREVSADSRRRLPLRPDRSPAKTVADHGAHGVEIELAHQIGTMGLNGLNTKTQGLSNLFTAQADGHQIENLLFAFGQGAAGRLARRRARLGREKAAQDETPDFRGKKGWCRLTLSTAASRTVPASVLSR